LKPATGTDRVINNRWEAWKYVGIFLSFVGYREVLAFIKKLVSPVAKLAFPMAHCSSIFLNQAHSDKSPTFIVQDSYPL
jgi:hypothetical protein